MAKTPAVPPTFKPSSREEFEQRRGGVPAVGPSGLRYTIRRIGRAQVAALGVLSSELKNAALSEARRAAAAGQDAERAALSVVTPEIVDDLRRERRETEKRLVLATVISPALTADDLEGDDPLVPTIDQEWLADVAAGQVDEDGQGRRLWGPEPLQSFERFRHHHECPDACEACQQVVADYTAFEAMRAGAA